MSPAENKRHKSFLRAFTAHEPAIRAFVRRLLPSRADADDVMQEVSVVLWEKFGTFREGGNFRAWAFGVARYEVLAWMRDQGRDRLVLNESLVLELADESEADDSRLEKQREALGRCLGKLPADQRDLMMQAYQPQASMQNLASGSGRSLSGFYQWLYRTRRSLMGCIQSVMEKEALR